MLNNLLGHHISLWSLGLSILFFFSSPWQQVLRSNLPSGDFCSLARFSLFCWPSVKIRQWQIDLHILKCLSSHWEWLQYFLPGFACGWRPLLAAQAHCSTAGCMRHDALWGWWEHLNATWHQCDMPTLCQHFRWCEYFQVSRSSVKLSFK